MRILTIQNKWLATVEENRDHVISLVRKEAKKQPVDIVCLPEFFTGPAWYMPGAERFKGIVDESIPGPTTDALMSLAKEISCYIVSGTLVERGEDGRYYNTSCLIGPSGEIVGKCQKVHRYAAESLVIEPGSDFPIFDTEFGKIAIVICSDLWISEVPRMLALKGAELFIVPGASIMQNIDVTAPCVLATAVLNVAAIVYTSVVGSTVGIRGDKEIALSFGGKSTVATPKGIIYEGSKEGEEVTVTELNMEEIRQLRRPDITFRNTFWWCLWGRRPELYGPIQEQYEGIDFDLYEWLKHNLR
ncbi:MAG: carbon-nitrogen hydrolase family protein [Thermoleophilia bacterium]